MHTKILTDRNFTCGTARYTTLECNGHLVMMRVSMKMTNY